MRYGEATVAGGLSGAVVLRFFYSTAPAGERSYVAHHHTEFEISLVRSGGGSYTIDGVPCEFSRGDVFLIGNNVPHYITRIAPGEPLEILNVHFEPKLIWASGSELSDLRFLDIFLGQQSRIALPLDSSNPVLPRVRELIAAVEREFSAREGEYPLMIKLHLMETFVTVARGFGCPTDAETPPIREQSLRGMEDAVNYINENLGEDITLERLADEAHMSRTYFCTLFKKLNGLTPWTYIQIKRIDRAATLLKSTDLTILEIATLCGFNNSTNFNRIFKKLTDSTPNSFRSKHRRTGDGSTGGTRLS